MATSNTFGSNPKGVRNKTSGAKGGGFSPPSAREHPPGKAKIGGVHSAGAQHKIAGGHMAGDQKAGLHPSLKKGK
jgi:hypothetical protein